MTNILFSFVSIIDSFITETIRCGLFSWAEADRKRPRMADITSAAGTPFPLTSPMQK